MLLALVYGVFLVLIGATVAALAVLISAHFSAAMLGTTAAHDRALIGLWADANVRGDELHPGALTDTRRAELEAQLAALAQRGGISWIELRDADGGLLMSSVSGTTAAAGLPAPRVGATQDFDVAASGNVATRLVNPGEVTDGGVTATTPLIQEFLPLVESQGGLAAVVGLWRDAGPMLTQLDATRNDFLLVTSVAVIVLVILLTTVFRASQRRLAAQSAALFESTRRDPLTGLLNHGAAVAALAERVEVARTAGAALGVALIDIDNFRLLNETHGFAAGDSALRVVSERIGEILPSGCIVGRYGPDEFIVIGPPVATEIVDQTVHSLRERLRSVAMRFETTEALPVTVSAGLAHYPQAARGVTDLLLAAANALADARASGGDATRSADAKTEEAAAHPTFNALQGLVFVVDHKDRYTKRHSEDVARYAVFLGRQVGLGEAQLEQLRLAGLLHDIGKVGIPDGILRKPGALNADEQAIVQQHVALGDLIARDLPDIDVVRAGIRFHHERWDGAGYLDHLAGEQIPMIARILAVCDAFSAMTTTRPYRKAMTVGEALKRLGDGAGSQLDERIVASFVAAMDSAADAPQPEDDSARFKLWLPARAA